MATTIPHSAAPPVPPLAMHRVKRECHADAAASPSGVPASASASSVVPAETPGSSLPPRPASQPATPRPSPRVKFASWEDRLQLFQREVQTEFCKFEVFADAQQSALALQNAKLTRREAEQKVIEEHKLQLQGLNLEKLSIRELEQLETVQVAAVRRTRKRKDALVTKEFARLEERVTTTEDEQKCKICLENPAQEVMIGCGHRCCQRCCSRLGGKCHICRQPFSATVHLLDA